LSPTTFFPIAIALPPSPSSLHAPTPSCLFLFHLYCRLGGEPTSEPTRDDLMVEKAGTKTSYYSSGGALVASRRPQLRRSACVFC
jgi:hypothetical protein